MITIHLHSDLHLEFVDTRLPGGDVLLLAGDICTARHLDREILQPGTKGSAYRDFFRDCGEKYRTILMVPGNHESYGHNVSRVVHDMSAHLPSNMVLMDQGVCEIDDWIFIVGTCWTDMNKGDPVSMSVIDCGMNDHHVIRYGDTYRKFTPAIATHIHREFIRWLKVQLAGYSDRKIFVMTHHAPTMESIHEKYRGEHHLNGAFASDLSELILDHPQIKYWAHGHIHTPSDYMVGTTRVIANPKGYTSEGNEGYNINFSLDLE